MSASFLRSHTWVKGFLAGAIGAALVVPAVSVIAQNGVPPSHSDLAEYQGMIRECRLIIPATSAEVFATTDQIASARIGTLPGGTVVKLTGVFRPSGGSNPVRMAQVYRPNGGYMSVQPVGWVRTDKLTTLSAGAQCPQP